MSIDCACNVDDYDDAEWYWTSDKKKKPLVTKRGRRCCSCNSVIKPQEQTIELDRFKYDEYGNEVWLASYWHCEKCADLQLFIDGMGWCFSIGDNLIKELERAEKEGF